MNPIDRVLSHVRDERESQDAKWGEQNHPDGTGTVEYQALAGIQRAITDAAAVAGKTTWVDILLEEVYEAAAEESEDRLREELIQVAAVAVAWVEAIDRRKPKRPIEGFKRNGKPLDADGDGRVDIP